jgi:hypothetical protein
MRVRGLLGLVIVVATWLPALPARALYIVPPEFTCPGKNVMARPSSFELTSMADIILIARVDAYYKPAPRDPFSRPGPTGSVKMHTETILKGKAPDVFDLPLGFQISDVDAPRPSVKCEYFLPEPGVSYVLYLSNNDDSIKILPVQHAHIVIKFNKNKPYATNLIKEYIKIQNQNNKDNYLFILEKMMKARMRPDATEEEQYQARHITDHLRAITPQMPTQHLIDLYTILSKGEMPPLGLRSDYEGDDFDERPWSEFLTGPEKRQCFGIYPSLAADHVLEALSIGKHPKADLLFVSNMKVNPGTSSTISAIKYASSINNFDRALEIIENEMNGSFYKLEPRERYYFLSSIAIALSGPDGKNPEYLSWNAKTPSAGRWPKLALKMAALSELPFRSSRQGDEALTQAIISNPLPERSEELSDKKMKTLGAFGSPRAIKWAKAQVKLYLSSLENPEKSPADFLETSLAIAMLLKAQENDFVKKSLNIGFCEKYFRMSDIIITIGENLEDYEILSSLLASDLSNFHAKTNLEQAILTAYARDVPDSTLKYRLGSPEALLSRSQFILLEAAMRGEKGPGTPFTCPAPPLQ